MVKINQNFIEFKEKFPNWKNDFSVYKRDDEIFQRIRCQWKESESKIHEYYACINVNNGDIYTDCRRRKIFARNAALLITRPIHTIFKTAWHLSIIGPLIFEAGHAKTKKEFLQNNIKSLADIVRTPLYGLAMTITNLAAIVFGIIKPNFLYKTREITGRLERKMLRADYIRDVKHDPFGL